MKSARSLQLSLLSLFAIGLGSGCGDDDKGTAPEIEIYKPQTSIENVIDNLAEAYRRQDAAQYGELFAESYHFVFSVLDVAENEDIPEEWGLSEELTSARNMFEDNLVEHVGLDFVVGAPRAATQSDVLDHDFPSGTMTVTVSEIELAVQVRDESGGEPTIFPVAGDQAVFFLFPHPTEKINGLPVWYIVEWRDVRIEVFAPTASATSEMATIESSWGGIKYFFRR